MSEEEKLEKEFRVNRDVIRRIREKMERPKPVWLLVWVVILAYFFANVEIQIEGGAGWAENLPTWRVKSHVLIDLFWGGRTFTGYHAWVFAFMALVFHFPLFLFGRWSLKLEARVLGSLMLFWIIEDFLWFVMNPSFGFSRLTPEFATWHRYWLLGVPVDYITFSLIGAALLWFSFRRKRTEKEENQDKEKPRENQPG